MNIFFYTIIFIIGILFGSFCTLAIYRIPKRQDITHTHSYCPNCNHKLGFFDLIPIFSYVFLRGKCRYCHEKIRPRYLIIEIISGIVFTLMAVLMQITPETLTITNIIQYSFLVLYLTFIILIAGIDRENIKIEKSVTIYGIVISIMYMLYLCIVEKSNIYRYSIYLIFYIIVLILDTVTLKKYAKDSYVTGILSVIITMAIFTGEFITVSSIIYTLLVVFFYMLIIKIRNIIRKHKRKKEYPEKKLSIAFFLGISNVIWIIFVLLTNNYIMA